jgi:hypothetical protein
MKVKGRSFAGRTLFAALGLGLSLAGLPAWAGNPEALNSITGKELKEHVAYLASEALEGRGAGQKGGIKAGEYIAKEFKRLGLKTGGDNSTYFQNFKAKGKNLRNVVAVLKGTDLANEYVVIGAHYDHLGRGEYGSLDMGASKGHIHNGADDNASGTSGILEIAEAYVEGNARPRRSIIFMLYDGEEMGLLGSKHYCANPTFPLASTIAMVNMDMIGRLGTNKLVVYGVPTGSTFKAQFDRANKNVNLGLNIKDTMTPNSDHASFYEKKIPSIALFTGLHGDYHRPGDDIDKVDVPGMEKIVKLAGSLTLEIANDDTKPVFAKAKDGGMESMLEQLKAMLGDRFDPSKLFGKGKDGKDGEGNGNMRDMLKRLFGNRGKPGDDKKSAPRGVQKPRFGVQVAGFEGGQGVKIAEVTPASVAAKAGVKADDVLVSFGKTQIKDFDSLRDAVGDARGKVALVVSRGGKMLNLTADFGSQAGPAKPAKKKKAKLY